MKYSWGLAAALWMVVSVLAGCDKSQNEIKAADAASNRAVLARDGKAFAEQLSKESFNHMTKMINLARTATKAQTKALSLSDKFDVLLIRATVEPERLRKMNAYEYIVRAVEDGEYLSTSGMRRVGISMDAARTQAKITYQPFFTDEKIVLHRIKEDGKWKEDWVANAAEWSAWGRAAAKADKVTEDEFAMYLISDWYDVELSEDIWNPVR